MRAMSPAWRLFEFAAVSGFVLALAFAGLIATAWPLVQRQLSRIDAGRRARLLCGMLVAPAVLGLLYAATLLTAAGARELPALRASCANHQGAWWHGCLWHPLEQRGEPWLWLALVVVAAGLLSTVLRAALGLWRGQRQLRTLIALSRSAEPEGDVLVVDVPTPLALAVGLGRGQVLLSRGLTDALSPDQLAAVKAHERAHLAHGDVRWQLIARVASLVHLPVTRRRLLDQLTLATEQRCDRHAAEVVGSPLLVAETLLAVERLNHGRSESKRLDPLLAVDFAHSFIDERILALLAPPDSASSGLGIGLLVAALVFLLCSAGWVHNLTELLVLLTAG
jgi:Zn-dependent protease with chaperone function